MTLTLLVAYLKGNTFGRTSYTPKICHSFNSRGDMEVGGGGGDEKKPGLDEGMGGGESVYTWAI